MGHQNHLRGLTSVTNESDGTPLLNFTADDDHLHNRIFLNSSDIVDDDVLFVAEQDSPSLAQNIFAYTMAIVFVAAMMWCTRSRVPGAEHHRGLIIRRRYEERRRRRERQERMQDPEFRKKFLIESLATARIKSYDKKTNQLTLGRVRRGDGSTVGDAENVNASSPPLEETEDTSTCVICLDVFEVGDKVAWSRHAMECSNGDDEADDAAQCRHVFHDDCIRGWLARHEDCPSCRLTLLKLPEEEEDEIKSESDGTIDRETEHTHQSYLDRSRHSIGDNTAFVIVRGLVSRVRDYASMSLVGQTIEAVTSSAATAEHPSSLPLRRVVSSGHSIAANSKRRRLSWLTFGGSDKDRVKSPPPNMPTSGLQLRRVKSIGPGSPVRKMQTGDDVENDGLWRDPAARSRASELSHLPPYPIPPPKSFGVPFRRTSSLTASGRRNSSSLIPSSSILDVNDESLTEDYEDDLMIVPTISSKDSSQLRLDSSPNHDEEEGNTSDDHTVPSSSQRRPLNSIPFRRVMSTGGAYSQVLSTASSAGSDTSGGTTSSQLERRSLLTRNASHNSLLQKQQENTKRPSVTWRDSRLAVSKSEDEHDMMMMLDDADDYDEEDEDDLLMPVAA